MKEKENSVWTGVAVAGVWFLILWGVSLVAILGWRLAKDAPNSRLSGLLTSAAISMAAIFAILLIRWCIHWRNLRRLFFWFVCLVTLVFLIRAEESWRGRFEWEHYKRRAEARGEAFSVAALAPPAVPDDENFAMTPLLKPAFDFTYTSQGIHWNDPDGQKNLVQLSANLGAGENNPPMGGLDNGQYTDLDSLRKFYLGNTNYPQPAVPGTAAENILVALSKFDDDIDELKNAAISRPFSRFPIHYNYEPPWAILLPHLSPIKQLGIIVNRRAVCELELRESAEAFSDLKLGLRLSDSIKEEPFLIDHLVRLVVLEMDLQTIREGIARHAWTNAQLTELEDYLGNINLPAEFKYSMRAEEADNIDMLDYLRRGPSASATLPVDESNANNWNTALKMAYIAGDSFFIQNKLTIAKMFDDFLFKEVDDSTMRVFPEANAALDAKLEKMKTGWWHHRDQIFAPLILTRFANADIRTARGQTYVDEAQVACALERHRLALGGLPDTLDALVPEFIEKIPTDVIDGQSLRYHKTANDGYIIYSIGWNQKDDGGTIAHTPDGKGIDIRTGDWVWSTSPL